MASTWYGRRLAKRVRPGDGRSLKPFRWWQLLRRSVLSITLPDDQGGVPFGLVRFSVEVMHGGEPDTGEVLARLYRDGRLSAQSRVPARFPVPGGVIDVQVSEVGMRRCHFVADDGTEQALVPDPRSAEGRRMRYAREHPGVSRVIGVVSVLALLIGLGLNLLQIAEPISAVPPIAERFGVFESPVRLPSWLNVTLALAATAGATERALRLRYHWLLDSGAAT